MKPSATYRATMFFLAACLKCNGSIFAYNIHDSTHSDDCLEICREYLLTLFEPHSVGVARLNLEQPSSTVDQSHSHH